MSDRPTIRLKKTRPWTDADDVQLRNMALAGDPVALIAAAIQRTVGATRTQARLLGVSVADNIQFRAKRNAWLVRQLRRQD